MSNITKVQATKLFREFELEGLPARVYHNDARPDADELTRDFSGVSTFMLRTGSSSEERNLPRRAGASPHEAEAWIRDLPARLDIIVQPYAPVVYSVELAWYGHEYVAELVPGIWELSTAISPVVITGQGSESAISGSITPQSATYFTDARGYYHEKARIEDWQIQALIAWVTTRESKLEALRRHLGVEAYGLKLHTALGYGLSPQNIRTNVPALDTSRQTGPSASLVHVTSVHDEIPDDTEVFLDVSVAREEHEVLSELIDRLVRAQTPVIYLKSGLLSHLAIALREAGLTVRSASAAVLRS